MPDRQAVLRANLRAASDAKGWNLKTLANRADVGESTVYGILSGKQNAGELVLSKLARALDTTPEALLANSTPGKTPALPPEALSAIERRLARMSRAQREHYLRMFTAMLEAGEQGGEYDSAGDGN